MLSVFGSCYKLSNKNLTVRLISSYLLSRRSYVTDGNNIKFHNYSSFPLNLCQAYNSQFFDVKSKLYSPLVEKRYFSKKKGSKRNVEVEDSDSDEEEYMEESIIEEEFGDGIITKTIPSVRIDSVLKAGLGVTKKKIEQEFYAMKLRVNGERVVKKAMNVHVGDEIDRVKGFSPDTSKFLLVDRIIIKGIDKLTATGMFPVKMEILKSLAIKNYDDPWSPDSIPPMEK